MPDTMRLSARRAGELSTQALATLVAAWNRGRFAVRLSKCTSRRRRASLPVNRTGVRQRFRAPRARVNAGCEAILDARAERKTPESSAY